MQDFIDQAEKNGVILVETGKCQFCGADYQRGIFECMENYNSGLLFFDFHDPKNQLYTFLSVDAHALQHPEIHGRWSNHFHLTRLHLILHKKETWDYKKSPLLSNFLNRYKSNRPDEFLKVPEPLARGKITANEVNKVTTALESAKLIFDWADEVYHSWGSNHGIVAQIADGFLESYYDAITQGKQTNFNI
jgi:hypothetical protein